ncbi:MAG: formylglycine-generating enzyme family protein, partial [Verrucomicrobiota bacterium]
MNLPWSWSRSVGRRSVSWLAVGVALLVARPRLFAQTNLLPVRVEVDSQGPVLVVPPVAARGLLLVAGAPGLGELGAVPDILFQTNTPQARELRVRLPADGPLAAQGFLRATHWAGVVPALVDLPAGAFTMGSPAAEAERSDAEGPLTRVNLLRSFRMGRFEVTQGEYRVLMGRNPSYFVGNTNRPVEQVSWGDATNYCGRLTTLLRTQGVLPAGWIFRLPTEAEWEYAARAGTTTAFGLGPVLRAGLANFDAKEWYDSLLGTQVSNAAPVLYLTTPGATFPANAWGLHDMHGNVWEWCLDTWQERLPGGEVTDPLARGTSAGQVLRGGCWYNSGRVCRS